MFLLTAEAVDVVKYEWAADHGEARTEICWEKFSIRFK